MRLFHFIKPSQVLNGLALSVALYDLYTNPESSRHFEAMTFGLSLLLPTAIRKLDGYNFITFVLNMGCIINPNQFNTIDSASQLLNIGIHLANGTKAVHNMEENDAEDRLVRQRIRMI